MMVQTIVLPLQCVIWQALLNGISEFVMHNSLIIIVANY